MAISMLQLTKTLDEQIRIQYDRNKGSDKSILKEVYDKVLEIIDECLIFHDAELDYEYEGRQGGDICHIEYSNLREDITVIIYLYEDKHEILTNRPLELWQK